MSPVYDYKFLLASALALTDAVYSTNQVNFGVANPNPGKSGMFGLHIVVTTSFGTLTSGAIIWVMHGAAEDPTTKHMGRFFTAAQLVAGKHYFIPCGHTLLQYARARFDKVTEDASAGAATMWFGPDEDGAE